MKPTTAQVLVNYHSVTCSGTWYQYHVEILDGMKRWVEDERREADQVKCTSDQKHQQGKVDIDASDGRPVIIPRRRVNGELFPLDLGRMELIENPLPIRIVKQLMMDLREALGDDALFLPYSGNCMYSNRKLFDKVEQKAARASARQANRKVSAEEGENRPNEVEDADYARTLPGIYHVRVKTDCDANDPDASKRPYSWFIVCLRQVAVRDLSRLGNGQLLTAQMAEKQALSQAVNIMLRSSFVFAGFPTISAYSFNKYPIQEILKSPQMKEMLRQNREIFPSVGVSQLLKLCMAGSNGTQAQPFIQRATKIGYLDRPDFPILHYDPHSKRLSIAGVDVLPNRIISDEAVRDRIESVLKKKKFSIWCKC